MKREPYSDLKYKQLANRICTTNQKFYYTDGYGKHEKFICEFGDEKYQELKYALYERGVYMIAGFHEYECAIYLYNDEIEYEDEENEI